MRIDWAAVRYYTGGAVAALSAAALFWLLIFIAGCSTPLPEMPHTGNPFRAGPGADTYPVLDWIAALACLSAFGTFILSFFVPEHFGRKLSATLLLCAVACWVLKHLLVHYLAWFAAGSVALAILTTALFTIGHWRWIKEHLGLDTPSPVPAALPPDVPAPLPSDAVGAAT
jgi:O-antigen/teichoic acid export membrane protein